MMPWEHLLVAAVPFVGYALVRERRLPDGATLLCLAVGSQFPDLVDKPLAWQFGLIPNGRLFMHSLVLAVPVSVLAVAVAHRAGRERLGWAFAVGHLLHLPGDFYSAVLGGSVYFPNNLFWPLVPPREVSKPEFVGDYELLTLSAPDFAMIGVGGVLFGYAVVAVALPAPVGRLRAYVTRRD